MPAGHVDLQAPPPKTGVAKTGHPSFTDFFNKSKRHSFFDKPFWLNISFKDPALKDIGILYELKKRVSTDDLCIPFGYYTKKRLDGDLPVCEPESPHIEIQVLKIVATTQVKNKISSRVRENILPEITGCNNCRYVPWTRNLTSPQNAKKVAMAYAAMIACSLTSKEYINIFKEAETTEESYFQKIAGYIDLMQKEDNFVIQ